MKKFIVLSFYFLIFVLVTNAAHAQSVYFNDTKPDTMVVGNNAYYELAINKTYGGFFYIKDKTTGENVSLGSPFGSMLWGVQYTDGTNLWSTSYPNLMSYEWNYQTKTLTLQYTPNQNELKPVSVSVSLTASESNYFDMKMFVSNNSGNIVKTINFPLELLFAFNGTSKAFVPCDYPGMILESSFFSQKRSFNQKYPGNMRADFVGLQIKNSNFSMYTLRDGLPVRSTWIGLNNDSKYTENTYSLRHDYQEWLLSGKSWSSPVTRLRITPTIIETVKILSQYFLSLKTPIKIMKKTKR